MQMMKGEKPDRQFFYCWSHGFGTNRNHIICKCTRKKEGHIDNAIGDNRQGGSINNAEKFGVTLWKSGDTKKFDSLIFNKNKLHKHSIFFSRPPNIHSKNNTSVIADTGASKTMAISETRIKHLKSGQKM